MAGTTINDRFKIIFDEYQNGVTHKRGLRPFSELINVSMVTAGKILNGKAEPSYKAVTGAVINLGYSPEWIYEGTGPKKGGLKDPMLVTEIASLKAKITIMQKQNDAMNARMKGYELEHENLKKLVEKVLKGTYQGH